MGLHRAGFEVTGVDLHPQKNYPFKFIQGDALDADLSGYDFVWASPPCQRHSGMSGCRPGLAEKYPDLIAPIREKLQAWGGDWIIENVPGAPLINPAMLCGQMFGLPLYRHRLFEGSRLLMTPPHEKHAIRGSRAGHWEWGTIMSVAGHCSPMPLARIAMGIKWMNRDELAESIPPAYSEYLARQFLAVHPVQIVGDLSGIVGDVQE